MLSVCAVRACLRDAHRNSRYCWPSNRRSRRSPNAMLSFRGRSPCLQTYRRSPARAEGVTRCEPASKARHSPVFRRAGSKSLFFRASANARLRAAPPKLRGFPKKARVKEQCSSQGASQAAMDSHVPFRAVAHRCLNGWSLLSRPANRHSRPRQTRSVGMQIHAAARHRLQASTGHSLEPRDEEAVGPAMLRMVAG